jgi:hypothetical protein
LRSQGRYPAQFARLIHADIAGAFVPWKPRI